MTIFDLSKRKEVRLVLKIEAGDLREFKVSDIMNLYQSKFMDLWLFEFSECHILRVFGIWYRINK